MRIYSVWFSALAISVFLSVATASADCTNDCETNYVACSQGCDDLPVCRCESSYDSCMNSCQYIDSDGDGFTDPNDNCPDSSNSNQADCDADGQGDACDSQDNSWGLISVGSSKCELDTDTVWNGHRLEFYYQNIYRSVCTGQICYDKYLRESFVCTWGYDEFQCCKDKWFDPDCGGAWNYDACGYPRCPF